MRRRKGALRPISVAVKIRQGRKACTLITGFETFGLGAEDLAEELRRVCASATAGAFFFYLLLCVEGVLTGVRAVSPLPGKTNDLEVMVQGKQVKAVTDVLVARGVPAKWIKSEDLSGKKK